MSKDECIVADWQIIGFEDGAAGRGSGEIGERRKACAKHGVTPNRVAYVKGYEEGIARYCHFGRGRSSGLAGYEPLQICPMGSDYHTGYKEGLKNFCTYESGYEYGLSGKSYRRVCTGSKEENFLDGYEPGYKIYSLRRELHSLEGKINNVQDQRQQVEDEQTELKRILIVDNSLTRGERAQVLLDIDTLRDEDDELEERKDYLLIETVKIREELSAMGVSE